MQFRFSFALADHFLGPPEGRFQHDFASANWTSRAKLPNCESLVCISPYRPVAEKTHQTSVLQLREIAQAGIANPPRMKQGQTRGVRVIPDTPKKPRMPRTLASNPKNAPHPVQKVLTARQMALRGQKMDKENFEDLVGKKSSKRRRGSPRRGISKRDSRRSTRRSSAR